MNVKVLSQDDMATAVNDLNTAHWQDYATGIAWGTLGLFAGVVAGYVSLFTLWFSGTIGLFEGMLISTLLLYLAFTVAHEAGHGNIAHEVRWMKPWERAMGWATTLPFLIVPFGLFARIHDYHHAFTNSPDQDPDHWVKGHRWWQAAPRALTLPLNYFYLTVTRFRKDPVIAATHRSSCIYYAGTLSFIVIMVIAGWGTEVLMLGVLPAFLASFVLGMLFDWVPHQPGGQQNRYQNTRTYLFPGLRFLTLGQNYHHIHHLYPRVNWYAYHRVFDVIRPELERQQAPIEALKPWPLRLSPFRHNQKQTLPGYGKSDFAHQPSSLAGTHQLTLRVENIQRETEDSVAITFANQRGKSLPFRAGQYVTVTQRVGTERVTRCYSLCESVYANRLSIGVKRVAGGVLSSYLNDVLRIGDELTVSGPFGDFVYEPGDARRVTLIAGGSGITPILSILQTALLGDDRAEVHLIYANAHPDAEMFRWLIKALEARYPARLRVTRIYQQAPASWQGLTGRLTPEILAGLVEEDAHAVFGRFYICGPEGVKHLSVQALQSLGVPQSQILVEDFTPQVVEARGEVHQVAIALANGAQHSLAVAENQTLLQAAQAQGVPLPHACGVGQCGCCALQVLTGEHTLTQPEPPGLLPGERDSGRTLACQCLPRSAMSLAEGHSILE